MTDPALREEDILEPVLRRIYAVWNERRGRKPMPTRAEMDLPFSIAFGLPFASLFDIETGHPGFARRYRYRLIGTEIVANMGRDVTGGYIDTVLEGDFRDQIIALFDRVIDSSQPLYHEIRYPWRSVRRSARLSLPLGEDRRVVQLLNCTVLVRDEGLPESYLDSLRHDHEGRDA